MSDIVTRLRREAAAYEELPHRIGDSDIPTMREAADEIERLRGALNAFSVSRPDADGIMWFYVDGGRGVQALINLNAMADFARVAIVDACDKARAALSKTRGE